MAAGGVAADDNVILRARENYKPEDPRQGIRFTKDCKFVLLNRHEVNPSHRRKLFFVYDVTGKYGFVPKNLVKDIRESPQARDMGVVFQDFEPVEPQELRLRSGDIVEITDKAPTGWYNGICKGRQGWFPKDFIKDDFNFDDSGGVLAHQFTVKAFSSCNASGGGEYLAFSASDFLDVVKRPTTGDSDWIGRNREGKLGKIPKNKLDERPDMPSVLFHWPWYHGDCSRDNAIALVEDKLNRPNHFLIRKSNSNKGDFAATITCGQNSDPLNIHIRTVVSEFRYDVDGKSFESLEEIVNHFGSHPIDTERTIDGRQIFLHHPVYRPGCNPQP